MPFKMVKEFIKYESSAGIILFLSAALAMVCANTPGVSVWYHTLFALPLSFHLGVLSFGKPLLLWVNDGFMAIFFLLVGLEIKREMLKGELDTFAKATLPAIAAFGGMLVPAIIYLIFNHANSLHIRGWAIPTATDIAFSLGILALLGKRIPVGLKIFLTALAIFDDLGAIVVIAIFYTQHISVILLLVALILLFMLFVFNRLNITRLGPYMIVGLVIWFCVLKSGVHATLAGVALGFAIPLHDRKNVHRSPLRQLEHKLHPWVAYGILPLFAFANAGLSFNELQLSSLINPVPLGIGLGLFIGKQLGIFGFTVAAIKLGLAKIPRKVNIWGIYGVSLLAGVGFTMSLFIGTLAFGHEDAYHQSLVRLGVIVGSLLSGVLGYIVLRKGIKSEDG